MKFRERQIGNQPIVTINGVSKEQILSSNYFKLRWTDNSSFEVEHEDNTVFLRTGPETRGVIGWFEE